MDGKRSMRRLTHFGGTIDSDISALHRNLTQNWHFECEEKNRLSDEEARKQNWKRWGPYLSERQWGTVREDYSQDGSAWEYFPFEDSHSRAYRWGEDGLLGITDRECRLCLSLGLWNGNDERIKERLFGLTGNQGNHGEDVKELYFYLDATPTYSYMKALYKYPQSSFPYEELLQVNQSRTKLDREYEIEDTDVWQNGYWDVQAEYSKASPNDILARYTLINRSDSFKEVHVLPQLWFRNIWSWGTFDEAAGDFDPTMHLNQDLTSDSCIVIECVHPTLKKFRLYVSVDPAKGQVRSKTKPLFTENDTNYQLLFQTDNKSPYTKDAFHRYLIHDEKNAVNSESKGTKSCILFHVAADAGQDIELRLRLTEITEENDNNDKDIKSLLGEDFEQVFQARIDEADDFYSNRHCQHASKEQKMIQRQAYAGLLWSKQFYFYVIDDWIQGDPKQPGPPEQRRHGRNTDWTHLFNRDVISMPDKWEYPWYACWDLAFHMIPMAVIDPHFAKQQLILFLREWYMHPNGQLPAYEWEFGDVNPPVHAWAVWRVYKMSAPRGQRDLGFLARCFHKLLLNFTWWINRKDPSGKHVFSGGFLGLDNIGVFDRSHPPTQDGEDLVQADATSWVAFFCVTMLDMALELAVHDPSYEDIASKFFEHFVQISSSINELNGTGLWDEETGFYYDTFLSESGQSFMKIRSMVGLVPLFACLVIKDEHFEKLPGFRARTKWFLKNLPDLARQVISESDAGVTDEGKSARRLLSLPSKEQLLRILDKLFDSEEFFADYGIRSMSRYHEEHPFVCGESSVKYTPGESETGLFGGNSNWRGPIWFPVNFLLVEALERYHYFYGDSLQVEVPKGSGIMMNLKEAADLISQNLTKIFMKSDNGQRPCFDGHEMFDKHENMDLLLFHEYFHPESGRGVGANHQTGWTSLITRLIDKTHQHQSP